VPAPPGITKKHLKQVEVMAGDLMGQYQSALLVNGAPLISGTDIHRGHTHTYAYNTQHTT
jgi:hypothetical protein